MAHWSGRRGIVVTSLVSALFGKLAEWLFGAVVEAAGERAGVRWFRRVCLALAILISAYITVASAFLWETDSQPGVMGLWQFTQQAGGPLWTLTTPILAALLTLLLLLPVAGRHSIGAALAAGVFGFGLASIIAMTGPGTHALSAPTLVSVLSSLVLPILALILAFGDVPPLDSFLAHVSWVYWGRIRHLRALRQYGATHRCQIVEPHGTDSSLSVAGLYDADHRVKAASMAHFQLSAGSGTPYYLQISMSSPRDIVAFRISFTKPEKAIYQRAFVGESRAKGKRTIYYFLLPDPRAPIPANFAPRMAQAIEQGRRLLRTRDFLLATPYGIRLTHYSGAFQFSPREANLGPYLAWMRSLIALFEEVTPAGVPTAWAN
jgi:hypothetical protein